MIRGTPHRIIDIQPRVGHTAGKVTEFPPNFLKNSEQMHAGQLGLDKVLARASAACNVNAVHWMIIWHENFEELKRNSPWQTVLKDHC